MGIYIEAAAAAAFASARNKCPAGSRSTLIYVANSRRRTILRRVFARAHAHVESNIAIILQFNFDELYFRK